MPDPMGRGRAILEHLKGRESESLHGVEVGVRFGMLSAYLLHELPGLFLTMVDPWLTVAFDHPARLSGQAWALDTQDVLDGYYAQALDRVDFARNRSQVIRQPSLFAAEGVKDGSQDFVFVDGDHLYEPCLADIGAWWPKVKSGGFLCGDDYENPLGDAAPNKWGVGEAVRTFSAEVGVAFEVTGRLPSQGKSYEDRCWFMVKP